MANWESAHAEMEGSTRVGWDWFSLSDPYKDELTAPLIDQPARFIIIGTIYFSSFGGGQHLINQVFDWLIDMTDG